MVMSLMANEKTRLLITGGSGFVGTVLCDKLEQQGIPYRAVIRTSHKFNDHNEVVYVSEINGETNWKDAVNGIDVVIHIAARVHVMNDSAVHSLKEFRKVNTEGTLNLAFQAADAGVKRFIFISSIKVNGEYTAYGKPFTENSSLSPQDAYAISKYEAEQGLLSIAKQTGMEVVIIRPPLVYGAGVKANFASMLRVVQRGIPLPFGAIYNKRSFVYVENLVSLILRCVIHPAAANQVFLVSDGYDLSTAELLRGCAVAMGLKSRLFPVPQTLIGIFASMLGKKDLVQRLCGNLQVDSSKAINLLDWVPPLSVEEGLKKTALGLVKDS